MKKFAAVMLGMMMMVTLAACGGTKETANDAKTEKTEDAGKEASTGGEKTVGIILKTLNSEYWSCMKAGIAQAEKDFGVKVD